MQIHAVTQRLKKWPPRDENPEKLLSVGSSSGSLSWFPIFDPYLLSLSSSVTAHIEAAAAHTATATARMNAKTLHIEDAPSHTVPATSHIEATTAHTATATAHMAPVTSHTETVTAHTEDATAHTAQHGDYNCVHGSTRRLRQPKRRLQHPMWHL